MANRAVVSPVAKVAADSKKLVAVNKVVANKVVANKVVANKVVANKVVANKVVEQLVAALLAVRQTVRVVRVARASPSNP